MSATSEVKEEAEALYMQGFELAGKFKAGMDSPGFRDIYNGWYTKAVRVVRTIAPERLKEFQSYYEIDPKRKFPGFRTLFDTRLSESCSSLSQCWV